MVDGLKLAGLPMLRMVDTVVERLGALDIAVNNAGVNFNNAAEDTPESEWDTTFSLNTKGLFLCCQVPQLHPNKINTRASDTRLEYFIAKRSHPVH